MFLYRLILTLAFPVLAGLAVLRLWRGSETRADLRQRLGYGDGMPGAIWIHAASNGELTSARGLIAAVSAAFPDRHLVITTNSTSGRALVQGWAMPRVAARLAPVDYRWALARFRQAWQPSALIVIENELWPNRLVTASEPVICVGARMSAGSARTWGRVAPLARQVLRKIRHLSAQDAGSADRFRALGLDPGRLGPVATLKSGVEMAAPDPAELAGLSRVFDRASTILAASTHDGEDQVVLAGFRAARRARPGLKLILAPRHPRRGDGIAARLGVSGLNWARRSAGEPPDTQTAVYLADTLGEMPLWYALAGITFVGGSLVPRGGHTPFEPAQARSAILHGPDVANFAAVYAALDAGGGAVEVLDADGLAGALGQLATAQAQAAQADRALAALARQDGAGELIQYTIRILKGLIAGPG